MALFRPTIVAANGSVEKYSERIEEPVLASAQPESPMVESGG
jgi:hypothetical protein